MRLKRDVGAEFVVVGGGSSGAALAGRLAEAGRDVVLLEAGPDYGAFGARRWPGELLDATALATSHDWGYRSGRWCFERARVIGGCSAHNGAIAAVGHRVDYDGWALPGWTADDVAPLFARVVEQLRVRAYRREEAVPFHEHCLVAAEAMGWTIASDLCDLDANESFGLETVNVVDGIRWNTAFAYLDPVRHLPNLRVIDHVLVDTVVDNAGIGDSGGATITAYRHGEPLTIRAGTVVLSAGVYGTPAILQRSGVGAKSLLNRLGIPVAVDLPGVGANLHDQPMMHVDRAVGPKLQSWLDDVAATGFLPEEQTLGKYVSGQAPDGIYDTHLFPVIGSNQTSLLYGRATIEVAVMTPLSRGEFSITSADPTAMPHIDHRYLSDPEGHDLAVMVDGLARANEMLDHPAVAAHVGDAVTDASTVEAVRAQVAHYYHPVGTAAMGADSDPMAACDARGRVRGLRNVVVADASLIPRTPRGNTNLPAIMIGERIADFLLS
ncbi:MAG: GMC family oxidoreductase [Acidimicrobiales bacterium]